MARTTKTSTVHARVTVSRRQVVTFQGRTLGSVTVEPEFLVVFRKRDRGGKFDNHRYPWSRVVAFVEGDGGRREPAYASVLTDTILRNVVGDVTRDGDQLTVVDDDGISHVIYDTDPSTILVSVIEETDERPEREPRVPRASAGKRRAPKIVDEDDDSTDDDEDGEDDEFADDAPADDEGEVADDNEFEDDEPPVKPSRVVKSKPSRANVVELPVRKPKAGKPEPVPAKRAVPTKTLPTKKAPVKKGAASRAISDW